MTKQSEVRNGLTHCKRVKTTFLLINVIMTLNSEVKLAQNKIPKLQILLRFELRYVTMSHHVATSHTWPSRCTLYASRPSSYSWIFCLNWFLTCFLGLDSCSPLCHTPTLMLPSSPGMGLSSSGNVSLHSSSKSCTRIGLWLCLGESGGWM